MGPVDATRALLKLNQKDGFDCQSCAWPSPDDNRSFAEFCENGAKAVADEGTKKRITPEFFARYSLAVVITINPSRDTVEAMRQLISDSKVTV